MKRLAIIAVAALALLYPAEAADDVTTGNELLAVCDEETGFTQGLCNGYIVGAAHMAQILGGHCPLKGVNNEQLHDVVVNGLRNDAANRHHYTAFLIYKYLKAAFPCSK